MRSRVRTPPGPPTDRGRRSNQQSISGWGKDPPSLSGGLAKSASIRLRVLKAPAVAATQPVGRRRAAEWAGRLFSAAGISRSPELLPAAFFHFDLVICKTGGKGLAADIESDYPNILLWQTSLTQTLRNIIELKRVNRTTGIFWRTPVNPRTGKLSVPSSPEDSALSEESELLGRGKARLLVSTDLEPS